MNQTLADHVCPADSESSAIKNWMPTLYQKVREKLSEEGTSELKHESYAFPQELQKTMDKRDPLKEQKQNESLSGQPRSSRCSQCPGHSSSSRADVEQQPLSTSTLPHSRRRALLQRPCSLSIATCWASWHGRLNLCTQGHIDSCRKGQAAPKDAGTAEVPCSPPLGEAAWVLRLCLPRSEIHQPP